MHSGIDLSKSSRHAAIVLVALFTPLLLASCESTDPKPDTGVTGNILIKDANNYTATSKLTIPRAQTAAGVDLDICWNAIVKDFLCHPLSVDNAIENVTFLQVVSLTEEQIQATLDAGQSLTKYVETYRDFHIAELAPGATCTKLSSLTFNHVPVAPAQDYVEAADKRYMLLFSKGTVMGTGARSMLFIQPTAASATTAVAAQDGCGILDFQPSLAATLPVSIPIAGPYVIDWSGITKDGLGNNVVFQNIDSLMLGYYEGFTMADVQTRFLDLELIADPMYQVEILTGSKSADLTTAKTSAGVPFAGFDKLTGTWVVALRCSTCQVPTPVTVSILTPTAS